jgi:hypothetical protein
MKRISTLFASALLALCFGVGQAAAEEPAGGADQAAGQFADSGQMADGDGDAYQSGAANRAFDIRVLSPGDSGDVTQSNSATAFGIAANDNDTSQSLDQSQTGGGYGSDYAQVAGQAATSEQDADADATAKQIEPTNQASSIRVLSPGDNGDVTQSNDATAGAIAKNDNDTHQDTDQSQSGGGSGSDYTQIAGQAAANDQDADADAKAVQLHPSNTASSIRVLSPGDDGDVTQSNSTTAFAIAKNDNDTKQSIDQSQGAVAAPAKAPAYDSKEKDGTSKGSDYTQIAGQKADSDQKADADAKAVQVKPSNTAASIRVLSPGDNGDVTQSNDATAVGIAKNDNETKQTIDQSQPGGYGSAYTQIAGQKADNDQKADADAKAVQVKPSNTAASIRVLSPGDDGDVTQSNSTTAIAAALNDNETKQSIDQTQGSSKPDMAAPAKGGYMDGKDGYGKDGKKDGSSYTQIAGQKADNDQKAFADATAVQIKPSNVNAPVRVLSKGDGGDVEQSNDAIALGIAKNDNETKQSIDQTQGGGMGSGSDYVQVAGQEADSEQKADADAFALQWKPSNVNAPVRVLSKGDDGDVTQSNSTAAIAAALNDNDTKQSIDQLQVGGRGHGSDYVQVAGQGSWSKQKADADATAIQLGASNVNAPVRVGSKSDGGKGHDGKGHDGKGHDSKGHDSKGHDDKGHDSKGHDSKGHDKGHGKMNDGGSVEQSNSVGAFGLALNSNETRQWLDQVQFGYGSLYLQVGGQGSWSDQDSDVMSFAKQGRMRNKKS